LLELWPEEDSAAATLKATGGLSCVLSAGISVPEEEVAPPDARQQEYRALLDGTIVHQAMLLPLVQDGILHARFKGGGVASSLLSSVFLLAWTLLNGGESGEAAKRKNSPAKTRKRTLGPPR
jgi:hypothetical protein